MKELAQVLDDIFAFDNYVHRSPVTMSMLGRCRRQAAYALDQGWPEDAEDSSPQAYLGRAIHTDLLRDLAARLGGSYEQPVELHAAGLVLLGTADLVLLDNVIDLKTTSARWFEVVKNRPPVSNILQVTGYGMALGKNWCTLVYLNRSDGEKFIVGPWPTVVYAQAVTEWLEDAQYPPEQTPRDERGPGLSMVCDSCPFKQQCWGPLDTSVLPQTVVANEVGVASALESYDRARQAEKVAKEEKEFWRSVADATPKGTYGDFELGWSGGTPSEVTDVEEAERMLTAAGLPIPKKTSYSKRSIRVTRAKPDPGNELAP